MANTDGFTSFMNQEAEYHRFAVYNEIDLPPPLAPDTDSDDETQVNEASILYLSNVVGKCVYVHFGSMF